MAEEALQHLGQYIETALGEDLIALSMDYDELALTIKPEAVVRVLTFLRDDASCTFKKLIDVCGVDYPEREDRFEVVYNLLSIKHNHRVRVKLSVNEDIPVDSVACVFSTANWFEREVWDLFGVKFNAHPDLRRILTDYGFEGHPLRKDFPLTGFVELRYDEAQKRVVYEPVKLTQDFRKFDFTSPWEGMTTVQLPGDEKARKPEFGLETMEDELEDLQKAAEEAS